MIPYMGGKNYLASWIIENFPENYPEMSYCEVFGGGGWVLFKKRPSILETYNDLNSDLVNLFKAIRDNYPEFSHKSEWSLHSKEMFEEALKKLSDNKFYSQVDKAISYAIKRAATFSGADSKSWGYVVNAKRLYSGKWLPFLKRMELINARLKRVQIECRDFEDILKRYDSPNTLFYLDPPYVDVEHYYNTNEVKFTNSDHYRLAAALKKIQGKFVISYYEHPLVRELYGNYNIIQKIASKHSCGVTRNSTSRTKPKSIELLIRNY